MIEFNEFKSEIPSLLEDVRKFTVDIHGFIRRSGEKLPSAPNLRKEEEFYDELAKISTVEATHAFVNPIDENIYLNFNELNNELYKEWAVAILSYFTPYQFVLETNYGKWVREKIKKGEKIKTSGILEGICKGFEIDAINNINGYRFNEIEDEIMERLEERKGKIPKVYEGYELYKKLRENVGDFKGKIDEVTAERIVKASLLVAGKDENFDRSYRGLASLPIKQIYAIAGGQIFEGKPLEELRELALSIENDAGRGVQWGVAPKGKTEDTLKSRYNAVVRECRLRGLPSKGLIDKLEEHYNNNLSRLGDKEVLPQDLVETTQNLMREIQEYCEKVEVRPKIFFR